MAEPLHISSNPLTKPAVIPDCIGGKPGKKRLANPSIPMRISRAATEKNRMHTPAESKISAVFLIPPVKSCTQLLLLLLLLLLLRLLLLLLLISPA